MLHRPCCTLHGYDVRWCVPARADFVHSDLAGRWRADHRNIQPCAPKQNSAKRKPKCVLSGAPWPVTNPSSHQRVGAAARNLAHRWFLRSWLMGLLFGRRCFVSLAVHVTPPPVGTAAPERRRRRRRRTRWVDRWVVGGAGVGDLTTHLHHTKTKAPKPQLAPSRCRCGRGEPSTRTRSGHGPAAGPMQTRG
jgi:hypothetical protein